MPEKFGPPEYNEGQVGQPSQQQQEMYPQHQPGTYPAVGYAPCQQSKYMTWQETYPTQQPGTYPVVGYAPCQQNVVQAVPLVVCPEVVFRETPIPMTCTHCEASIITETYYETGALTWLIFGILCFLLLWICCFIPFCVNSCKDVVHKCPNCKATLGFYRRLGS